MNNPGAVGHTQLQVLDLLASAAIPLTKTVLTDLWAKADIQEFVYKAKWEDNTINHHIKEISPIY